MATLRQFCLTLDLRDDDELIREYEALHRRGSVWPENIAGIRESGILDMQIYRIGTQLIMVLTVDDDFSFEEKARSDSQNPKVMEWERLMEKFQHVEPGTGVRAKWRQLRNIFGLGEHSPER
jgi:L-rhamnose mutarotase